MNKERLFNGIDAITDKNWGFRKVWRKDYDGSINPEYISKDEARLLKIIGLIFPEKIMPGIIRQWSGEEGEMKFKERVENT